MNMKKIAIAFLFVSGLASLFQASAQEQQLTLKCEQIGEIKSDKKFAPEEGWLMLTTDLYLLNPESFKGVLETLHTSKKEKDKIENVLITAQLTSTTIAPELRYPLYNLTVDFVNKELSINKSNTQGKIRIADNVPLNVYGSASVDIKLSARDMGEDQPHALFQFASNQLAQIGKVRNDYSAMNKVSEEYGKLIDCKLKDRQYVFNATVSPFDELEVDRQLFSICLYEFGPSNKDIERNFSSASLKKCVDGNEKVDYDVIRRNVLKKDSPIIVAVNYKSVRKPDVRKPNLMNDDYVNSRIVKVRNLYASKVISEDVYAQEDELNDFMKDYVAFDKETKRYKENKARGAAGLNPIAIIDGYHGLLSDVMMKNVKKEFLYESVFQPHYQAIVSTAKASLKDGKELEQIEKLVNIMVMEKDTDNITPNKARENFAILNAAQSYVEDTKWEVNVEDLLDKYSDAYFDKIYRAKLEPLLQGDPKSKTQLYESLKKELEASDCKFCKDQAAESYFEPYEDKVNEINAEEAQKEAEAKAAEAKAKRAKARKKK